MSLTFVQANSFANGGSTSVSLAYTSPNMAGNLGAVWMFTANGELPISLTDSQGNAWCLRNSINTNLGSISVWTCGNLKAGANTVSCNFFNSPINGTPSIIIEEYHPSGAATILAINSESIRGLNPNSVLDYYASVVAGVPSNFTAYPIMAVYDLNSAHAWVANTPDVVRAQNNEGGVACNGVGDSVSGLGNNLFSMTLYNPVVGPPPYQSNVLQIVVIA